MKVIYVNKRCEASMLKHAFEAAGFRVFCVRTECQCQQKDNRRDGLIVLNGDKVLLEIRRCKECFRRQNPQLFAGGMGK